MTADPKHRLRSFQGAALLALGTVLTVLTHFRWSVGLLAWVAPVPFILFLNRYRSKGAKAILAATLCVAWTVATLKIMTAPLPATMALMFGLPLGLLATFGYITWDALRHRLSSHHANLAFASVFVVVEYIQHTLTPLGSWGAAAYTQMDNLALMQSASLFGLAGVGFVVYWCAAIVAEGVRSRVFPLRQFTAWALILAMANIWGAIRLGWGTSDGVQSTLVAAVGTDATFGGVPLPSQEDLEEINDALFVRTISAAKAGAKLIVWNEAATLALPDDEQTLIERGRAVALENNIDLVMAYAVPVQVAPLRFENKYVWLTPEGQIDHKYLKHEPVPGEPAVRGTGPMHVVESSIGRASGAICYDYDFPSIGRAHAALNLDLVVVPSSDWLGIDPFHSYMAGVRAIEGGYNLLRSTRMGLSVGIDAYGRVLAELSSNTSDDRILLVSLPKRSVATLYNAVGDSFVWILIAYLLLLAVTCFRSRNVPNLTRLAAPTTARN